MSYADAFAPAMALVHHGELWTGDPELLVSHAPWRRSNFDGADAEGRGSVGGTGDVGHTGFRLDAGRWAGEESLIAALCRGKRRRSG